MSNNSRFSNCTHKSSSPSRFVLPPPPQPSQAVAEPPHTIHSLPLFHISTRVRPTTTDKLIVADVKFGLIHWFDPETGSWSGPVVLDPGQPVTSYQIGCSDNNDLLLIGVCKIENVDKLKIWRFGENDDFAVFEGDRRNADGEFVTKLKGGESFGSLLVDIRVAGNIVYVYSAWAEEEVVACEAMRGDACGWWSVRNVVARDEMIMKRFAYSCSEVGIGDLQWARVTKGWRFL